MPCCCREAGERQHWGEKGQNKSDDDGTNSDAVVAATDADAHSKTNYILMSSLFLLGALQRITTTTTCLVLHFPDKLHCLFRFFPFVCLFSRCP